MNKKYVFAILMLIAVFVVAGCGSSIGGNIIKDEGSLVKIMDEFKNLDGLKGKEILVFQDVNMYTGETGNRVVINILKPGTDDEVDNYEYRGGWSKARPVQLSGSGKAVLCQIDQTAGFAPAAGMFVRLLAQECFSKTQGQLLFTNTFRAVKKQCMRPVTRLQQPG